MLMEPRSQEWEPPADHFIMESMIDCYLSSDYDDPNFLAWSGPSILSPLTQAEGLFRYVSSIFPSHIHWLEIQFSVIHKYTGESIAVLPFFLPRVEHTPGNLARCRERIWRLVVQCSRSKSSADFRFEIFIWPRDALGWSVNGTIGRFDSISPEWTLNPARFVHNIYYS
ncbi:hypothetical protein FE257_001458 [Aspergillus nanangensis]|uniref:Uncharacterized protein n=1 Tax=Aspergillus nanangensis TaxID=2582783 RepID=A0AAD4CDP6_ASPNN|nr:hypothetical protein FE257_001458 [Aspergillus nanangensis]